MVKLVEKACLPNIEHYYFAVLLLIWRELNWERTANIIFSGGANKIHGKKVAHGKSDNLP
jgi:hypothetical protein